MCDVLLRHADTGRAVDIYGPITMCALDIISESAMGHVIGAQRTHNNKYVQAIHKSVAPFIMTCFGIV